MKNEVTMLLIGSNFNGVEGGTGVRLKLICADNRQRAIDTLTRGEWMTLETCDEVCFVEKPDIVFAEMGLDGLDIHTKERCITSVRCGMNEFVARAGSEMFRRCHKSFAVNLNYIDGISKVTSRLWEIKLKDCVGTCLMSRSYKMDVLSCLGIED